MKPRHFCEDFRCVVCSPATAKAYQEGYAAASIENERLFLKMERYRDGLMSISKNSCCNQCQQAKWVALSALKEANETIQRKVT